MIFKRKSKIALVACTILSCIVLVVSSAAGAGQPGSDADPLVTKSYVDQKIAQLSAQIGSGSSTGSGTVNNATITQLQTDVGDLTKFIVDALTEIETLKARVDSLENGYAVVEAKAGQKVILAGGSEAILRSGAAEALVGTYGGLVDASIGGDIDKNGMKIPVQHLLISARSDGRGLLIKQNAYLLIRGAYTIK
ncbi:MAG TPA: hypothetical protein GXZ22_06525 [Clostridiaceae bacterium]|jgi:outer membrane murein-binding lipoprotein Lpp|nr:hypothetical protein [Clostridiaceae bacterium]